MRPFRGRKDTRAGQQSAIRNLVAPDPFGRPAKPEFILSGFTSGAFYADGISNCFAMTIEPFFVESSRICLTGTFSPDHY